MSCSTGNGQVSKSLVLHGTAYSVGGLVDQINHVYKKLIKYCSIFYKLRRILPLKVPEQVYFAFVHSHILYAVEINANTHKSYLDKLIKLNNKLFRIIQDQPRRTHIIELYENYSTLPVILLHQQNLILFAHNTLWVKKNWATFLRPIPLEILNRSLPNWAQITFSSCWTGMVLWSHRLEYFEYNFTCI